MYGHFLFPPAALGALSCLVSLSISNCALYELPPAVMTLPKLRVRRGRGDAPCLREAREAAPTFTTTLPPTHLHPAPQALYCEHNDMRRFPPGPYWSRLRVLRWAPPGLLPPCSPALHTALLGLWVCSAPGFLSKPHDVALVSSHSPCPLPLPPPFPLPPQHGLGAAAAVAPPAPAGPPPAQAGPGQPVRLVSAPGPGSLLRWLGLPAALGWAPCGAAGK